VFVSCAALLTPITEPKLLFPFMSRFAARFYVIGVVLLSTAATNEAVITQFYPCSAFRLTIDDIVMQIAAPCMDGNQPDSALNECRYSVSCIPSLNYATFALSTLERFREYLHSRISACTKIKLLIRRRKKTR